MTYIEYQNMFLGPQFLSDAYVRKRRDGRQWDDLACVHAQTLIAELRRLASGHPTAFELLLPSGSIPKGLESIAAENPDFLPWQHS